MNTCSLAPHVGIDEIDWTPRCSIRFEDSSLEDLLALTPAQLLAYAATCREDLRTVRELLHQAVELIAQQQDQLARAARIVDHQRRELRRLRQDAAA